MTEIERVTSSDEALRLALELTANDSELSEIADRHRRTIRAFLEDHGPVALTRGCSPGHLTASCLLWDAAGERVLRVTAAPVVWLRDLGVFFFCFPGMVANLIKPLLW